jgi:hypothetical protein
VNTITIGEDTWLVEGAVTVHDEIYLVFTLDEKIAVWKVKPNGARPVKDDERATAIDKLRVDTEEFVKQITAHTLEKIREEAEEHDRKRIGGVID